MVVQYEPRAPQLLHHNKRIFLDSLPQQILPLLLMTVLALCRFLRNQTSWESFHGTRWRGTPLVSTNMESLRSTDKQERCVLQITPILREVCNFHVIMDIVRIFLPCLSLNPNNYIAIAIAIASWHLTPRAPSPKPNPTVLS